jgi:2-dehydro-3-deoxyphosphogluconate aldolase/(4S)-4-hydroxy-2-oxoglutarate aldolase
MNEILQKISSIGIVPVVKLDDSNNALPLAKALYAGGLPCAEITFRTPAAKESIKLISEALPEMLVGAGTVLTTLQVDEATAAGAKFIVSPGFNRKIVEYCIALGIPVIPGCADPSDIEQAIELGLEAVKFFPAEAAGGLNMIKAMSAPYVNMKFMPTGGINQKNLNDYLSFKKVIACGGSWMVSDKLINEKKFDEISELTRQAVEQMLGFELAHIGINADSVGQAGNIANAFCDLFSLEKKDGNSLVYAGTGIEVMKPPVRGVKGHIAFKTNSIDRAVSYLKSRGYEFDEQSIKYDENGNKIVIYLAEEIGGFAVHLLQKK